VLSWLTAVKARTHARACWIKAGCNPSLAEEYFRDIYTDASDELTNEALDLAYERWQNWINRGISEPPEIPDRHEPRFRD
jgi:hypothetical protein